ncbi:hypothetical protein ACTFIW_012082 [Dictyostelium discoideum]
MFAHVVVPATISTNQERGFLSILELTSLDDTNSQVCPVRHLATYLRASKGRRKPHSGDSDFIQNEGKPLDVKEINIIVLSTLSSSGIDISKFKSHSTRSAMASLLLSRSWVVGNQTILISDGLFKHRVDAYIPPIDLVIKFHGEFLAWSSIIKSCNGDLQKS